MKKQDTRSEFDGTLGISAVAMLVGCSCGAIEAGRTRGDLVPILIPNRRGRAKRRYKIADVLHFRELWRASHKVMASGIEADIARVLEHLKGES